ncbi:putative low molecular weight phosphotyrosine protein phosphatase [Talaromyces proteolyticus]|uniref:Low molecular weight phosphotyrosine protein phosphatase n=1 Tax=Talaromyces proteolyticus TaxID=1131652 RepID=A0AAD4Q4M1_9EURO|nr:putative low molecular weight phosphotyrosine protein phosphatase [Talaromyces proteolyticus]KAH8703249.1 putative low molecular weight phosphotyrosine protein phosphatase [Talaromyces proteolyticus]
MASPPNPAPASVLFVCLGNICRSTMAEGVFRSLAAPHRTSLIGEIDSAGTGAYHVNDPPDYRTMTTLRAHGIKDYNHAARKVTKDDFRTFDYILAMDQYNLRDLLRLRDSVAAGARKGGTRAATTPGADANIAEVRLFGDFNSDGTLNKRVGGGQEIEDPYYGGIHGFETAYEQAVGYSKGFLAYLEKKKAGPEN